MKSFKQYINERLLINKNFHKIDKIIDDYIDEEKKHLFKNISLNKDNLDISSLYWTIQGSSIREIVKIDPEYAKQCLIDNDLYDKESEAIYLPQIDYTYVKQLDTSMFEKYDRKNLMKNDGYKDYDIYTLKTDNYFVLRIVVESEKIILDFVISLDIIL